MLSDPEAQHPPADWYLIASEGDLVLRLVQDLHIGEDGLGGIVLSPAREDALLLVSTRGSELTLQALAMHWTFTETGGSTRQFMTFPPGTSLKLNFPTCSLVITPDFLAGERVRPDRVLDLKPITSPTVALSRLAEPVTLVEQREVTNESRQPIGVATTEEVAALLEAANDDVSERLLLGGHDVPDETVPAEQPPGEQPIHAPTAATPPSDDGRKDSANVRPADQTAPVSAAPIARPQARRPLRAQSRRRHRLLAAGIAALAVAAPMMLYIEKPAGLGVDFHPADALPSGETLENPPGDLPAAVAAEAPEPAGQNSGTGTANRSVDAPPFEEPLPLAETAESPFPDAEVSAGAERSPGAAEAGSTGTDPPPVTQPVADSPAASGSAQAALTETEQARLDVLLAQAQTLIDSGAIVTPVDDNAVALLIEVLTLDPDNEAGLRLMYTSAVRLVEQAEAAHAAGNDYLARNLLEDVLGFHPDFEMARKLREDWQEDWDGSGNG